MKYFMLTLAMAMTMLLSCGGGGGLVNNNCTGNIRATFLNDSAYIPLIPTLTARVAKIEIRASTDIDLLSLRFSLSYFLDAGEQDLFFTLLENNQPLMTMKNDANGKIDFVFAKGNLAFVSDVSRTFTITSDLSNFVKRGDGIQLSIGDKDYWLFDCGLDTTLASPLADGPIYGPSYSKK